MIFHVFDKKTSKRSLSAFGTVYSPMAEVHDIERESAEEQKHLQK